MVTKQIEIEGNGENSRISRLRFEGKPEKRNAIDGHNRAWKKTVMNCHKRPKKELNGNTQRQGKGDRFIFP